MTDRADWSAGKLDLEAYLRRAGLEPGAALPPTGETLAALHRAHLAAFPFENLDILLGRGVRVDLESIQAKLVGAGRGGYCFEHGQLFGAALERLGFAVDRLLARVSRPGPPGPRTHLTLRVRAGSGPDAGGWLADVGFGSSPAGPVPLAARGPHQIDGWTYDVAPGAGTWLLRELQAGEWAALYRFEDPPVYPADVVMANHYTSTHPDSWFTHTPVVVRREPGAVRSLLGRVYTVTRPGHVKERRELSGADWAAALREIFGLSFTPGETARLVEAANSALPAPSSLRRLPSRPRVLTGTQESGGPALWIHMGIVR